MKNSVETLFICEASLLRFTADFGCCCCYRPFYLCVFVIVIAIVLYLFSLKV